MAETASATDLISVLEETKEDLEIAHCVRIQEEALTVAANFARDFFSGSDKLEQYAIEIVEKACMRLRQRIEANAEDQELDLNEFMLWRSLIESHELKKEKDIFSKAWLIRVDKELKDSTSNWDTFRKKWKPLLMLRLRSKRRAEEIYRLEKLRNVLVSSLQKTEKSTVLASLCGAVRNLGLILAELELMMHEHFKQNWTVGSDHITEVVSDLTGIPVWWLTRNRRLQMCLGERFHERVIGQYQAIEAVMKILLSPRSGMSGSHRPVGSFLFLGASGVGKAEFAKALAKLLFGNENFLTRIDMLEYMESHSISRLIGTYSRSDSHEECAGGQLTDAVRKRPYSVVLFDKVDKAHDSVINTLLEILIDGRVTDSKGEAVDFSKTVIIMTSNVGEFRPPCTCFAGIDRKRLSQSSSQSSDFPKHHCTVKVSPQGQFLQEARKVFKPELLKLLDKIIVFNRFYLEQRKAVARLRLRDVASTITQGGINLYASDAALNVITRNSFTVNERNGKGIKRWIDENLETILSGILAKDDIDVNSTVYIDTMVGKTELSFRVEKNKGFVEDWIFEQFKEKAGEFRVMYGKERERVESIFRLRRGHFYLMRSLLDVGVGADLVHIAGAIQELVKTIDEFVKSTIHVNPMPDESLELALGYLKHSADLMKRQRDKQRVEGLGKRLHKRVLRQFQYFDIIAEAVLRSIDAPLEFSRRPGGLFLFLGLESVFKVELAKYLRENLVTDDGISLLIQIDMSEYRDPESLAKLLGGSSCSTSHGRERGSQLLESVRRRPYSVVLFDQVEEAHASVFSALIQMIDRGILTDSQGNMVDFRNIVFIIASDLGKKEMIAKLFGHSSTCAYSVQKQTSKKERRHFRFELLNCVDEIVFFNPFSANQLCEVARLPMMDGRHLHDGGALALSMSIFQLFQDGWDPIYDRFPKCPVDVAVDHFAKGLIKEGLAATSAATVN